ncbi:MAG TPA: dihydropteroate synthase, partial [Flavisolibacter sp.]|nr:dihydropteroate synthase [Flavisolibacter sp.]
PLLVGLSRKATVYKTLQTTPDKALNGTTVLHTMALLNGATILRVHDVKEAKEAIQLYLAYSA